MDENAKRHDELEILATVADYCHAVDERGGEGVGELFTEDARLTMMGESVSGRAAITTLLTRPRRRQLIHLAANPVLSISGNTAAGTVDHLLLTRIADGHLQPVVFGRWVDRYVRADDRWLLAERTVEFPYGPPAAD
jgi:ketosteroid isomerase-like protein